ncbi:MAG TPA: hypothetical protein VGE74_32700 [Gemmata sp.]
MRVFPLSTRTAAVLLCALAVAPAAGCGSSTPQTALDEFEANRAKAQQRMDAIEARYAACELPADRAGNEKFVAAWKDHWEDIEAEVKKLKRELTRVTKSFDRHFRRMQEVAQSIVSPEMKSAELGKNADLRRRWVATVTEADANLKKMDDQVTTAKDIYKVLRLAAMRGSAEAKMAEIRALNQQIRGTVGELEKVTAEGRALVVGY